MKTAKGIISAIALLVILYFIFGGGKEEYVASEMNKIENQVALDFEKQYEIAKKNGGALEAYTAAAQVAAAYLQAKDEPNYKKWKDIEKEEAKRAGMPVQ